MYAGFDSVRKEQSCWRITKYGKLQKLPNFIWKPNQWYSITAERRGSRVCHANCKDGPTLYADHPAFGQSASSGGNGLGVAGPKKGEIEIDDLTIWSIQKQARTGWPAVRAKFPKFKPVQLKKPKNQTKPKNCPRQIRPQPTAHNHKRRNAEK